MRLYYCVRVYGNGEARHTTRDQAGMEGWVAYNKKWRFGCSLFVDGFYIPETGNLHNKPGVIEAIEKELKEQIEKRIDIPDQDTMNFRDEYPPHNLRYPDEAGRKGFRHITHA